MILRLYRSNETERRRCVPLTVPHIKIHLIRLNYKYIVHHIVPATLLLAFNVVVVPKDVMVNDNYVPLSNGSRVICRYRYNLCKSV